MISLLARLRQATKKITGLTSLLAIRRGPVAKNRRINYLSLSQKMKPLSQVMGFTLIELLVVISIIGFLVTAAITTFSVVRARARDAIRAANIATIGRALELYLAEYQGYPASNGECLRSGSGAGQILENFKTVIKVPGDPLWPLTPPTNFQGGTTLDYPIPPSARFCYWYFYDNAVSQDYYLSYYLESNSKAGNSGIHVSTPSGAK